MRSLFLSHNQWFGFKHPFRFPSVPKDPTLLLDATTYSAVPGGGGDLCPALDRHSAQGDLRPSRKKRMRRSSCYRLFRLASNVCTSDSRLLPSSLE